MTRPPPVSCPINNLLNPPADFRAVQGAPTIFKGHGRGGATPPAAKRRGAASRIRSDGHLETRQRLGEIHLARQTRGSIAEIR